MSGVQIEGERPSENPSRPSQTNSQDPDATILLMDQALENDMHTNPKVQRTKLNMTNISMQTSMI